MATENDNDMEDKLPEKDIAALEEDRLKMLEDAGIDQAAILEQAQQSQAAWTSYFNDNIRRARDDVNFCLRDQWSTRERSEFRRLEKPALTFNKIYDAVKKVIGEQRQNKPDLMVRSLTGKASEEEIDLRADLVRTISYQSQNDLVYQTAFRSALLGGYGSFQLSIEYENPKSFNQIVKFNVVPDANQTFFDPSAIKPHKGDGEFCGRYYEYSLEEFNATFPYISNPESCTPNESGIFRDDKWRSKDTIIVCDFFVKDWYPVIIHQLSNGLVVTEKEWEEMQKVFAYKRDVAEEMLELGQLVKEDIPTIKATRQSQEYRIMHYRHVKNQIIEFSVWPSKFLPIIFVDGDSAYVEGRQHARSFIHGAIDAQRCVNYFGSEIAGEVKNRRREQWIGTKANVEGVEQMWKNPEVQQGILLAEPDPKTGQMPTKMPPFELSQSLMQNFMRSSQDIREILGFSESQQVSGRDISGAARRERKLEGSMSAYVYFDNLNQAIEQAGRLVLDLLPSVYGGDERNVTLSKADGSTKPIVLNQRISEEETNNFLSPGEFDVEIDAGPSFAVQKETAIQMLTQLLQAQPTVFPLVADLWAKNMDVQFMPQLVKRLENIVPPEIMAKEKGEPPPPPKPNPQEQMMQQEFKLKEAQLKERAEKLRIEQEQHELDKVKLMLEAKEMIAKNNREDLKQSGETRRANMEFTAKIADILSKTGKNIK